MICGLVLAAGAGTRFGESSKLLASLHGRPLLEHAVQAQCAVAAIDRVMVVLGSRADEVRAAVEFGRAEPVVCADWESGPGASLRCGLRALADASKVIVTLGDEPLLTPALIARFVPEPPGTRAVFGGRPGHPVVLGPKHYDAVADQGARDLLRGGRTIECAGLGSDRDVDTPEDLEAIRHEARAVI